MASSTSLDNAVYAQAPSPVVTTTSNRRRRTFLWLGLGLFLIIAVALIVGLVVWRLTRCSVEPLDTDTNECLLTPCGSGGTCTDAVNGYMCGCADGFTGANCETNIDESNSTPTVEPLDTDTNECLSTPCGSGGTCTDAVNGYTCGCADGFTGTNCETTIGECSSTPCQGAGSTCTDDVNRYTCACITGRSGVNCEILCTTNGGVCSAGSQCCSGICPTNRANQDICVACLQRDEETCTYNSECCTDFTVGVDLYLKCENQDKCTACGDRQINDACDDSKDCCAGLRCDRKLPQGGKHGTCVVCNRLQEGDPCTAHSDCCTDFQCKQNECRECNQDRHDQTCSVDSDCECGFLCIAAKCGCATGNVGDGCTEDHDCCRPYSCSPTTLQCYAPP